MAVKSMRDHFNTRDTPQSEPIPGKQMTQNNAGGYSFEANDWQKLDRFLVLGTAGGSYYVGERKLTIENAEIVRKLLTEDGQRVVQRIVTISKEGRAPKNDPAIFALAMAASLGDVKTRQAALAALPQVCRIGTHLYHFVYFMEGFRGWGRAARRAVRNWYADRDVDWLALQAIKYKSRDGWSHRDMLRLAHPQPDTSERDAVYRYMVGGIEKVSETERTVRVRNEAGHFVKDEDGRFVTKAIEVPNLSESLHVQIEATEALKKIDRVGDACAVIREYRLPREAVPTHLLNEREVWQVLLEDMPMTAMIRNLGKMTKVGLLSENSEETEKVVGKIGSAEILHKARIHPLAVLAALVAYQGGTSARAVQQGRANANSWTPVKKIVDALDAAFYTTFKNVVPTNRRLMLALDVSGSMGWGTIASIPNLTPRVASAALALVTANVESDYTMVAYQTTLTPLKITPRMRLDGAIKAVSGLPFGGTDCSLPMLYADSNGMDVDAFISYTDSETWAGRAHPSQALQNYRRKRGINAKSVVVGMMANRFTIADPDDPGQLDVVGFDTATPNVINDFIRS